MEGASWVGRILLCIGSWSEGPLAGLLGILHRRLDSGSRVSGRLWLYMGRLGEGAVSSLCHYPIICPQRHHSASLNSALRERGSPTCARLPAFAKDHQLNRSR